MSAAHSSVETITFVTGGSFFSYAFYVETGWTVISGGGMALTLTEYSTSAGVTASFTIPAQTIKTYLFGAVLAAAMTANSPNGYVYSSTGSSVNANSNTMPGVTPATPGNSFVLKNTSTNVRFDVN